MEFEPSMPGPKVTLEYPIARTDIDKWKVNEAHVRAFLPPW